MQTKTRNEIEIVEIIKRTQTQDIYNIEILIGNTPLKCTVAYKTKTVLVTLNRIDTSNGNDNIYRNAFESTLLSFKF